MVECIITKKRVLDGLTTLAERAREIVRATVSSLRKIAIIARY